MTLNYILFVRISVASWQFHLTSGNLPTSLWKILEETETAITCVNTFYHHCSLFPAYYYGGGEHKEKWGCFSAVISSCFPPLPLAVLSEALYLLTQTSRSSRQSCQGHELSDYQGLHFFACSMMVNFRCLPDCTKGCLNSW